MTKYALLAAFGFVLLPVFVVAQYAPYTQVSQVVVTSQVAPGVALPPTSSLVMVTATGPSLFGVPNTSSSVLSFPTTFGGDMHTVTFVPGSYTVTVNPPAGYFIQYSPDCSGFTSLVGSIKYCTLTLTMTPTPTSPCSYWNGTAYTCNTPVLQYVGPMGQEPLSCAPATQTVHFGQPVTLTAFGGTPGGYNWVTPNRTFQNVGTKLTTTLDSTGLQSVKVTNGVQTAVCTVNVLAGGIITPYAAETSVYLGSSYIAAPAVYAPGLPNTGFAPTSTASSAVALLLVCALVVLLYPYAKKAFATIS